MSIIHAYLSTDKIKQLSHADREYLKQQLVDNTLLNKLLHRPINKPLLAELQCVLDSKPIARWHTRYDSKNSNVRVFNVEGKLIRIENCIGRTIKEIE